MIPPCESNPCLHNGQCRSTSLTSFECDCSSNKYRGTVCEIGILSTPAIPILIVNQPSHFLNITAYPEAHLRVTVLSSSNDLQVIQSTHNLSNSQPLSNFKLIAIKEGVYTISYSLSGTDSQDFIAPMPVRVVVVSGIADIIGAGYEESIPDMLSPGCCNMNAGLSYQCPDSTDTIVFNSSNIWKSTSNGDLITDGVVFAFTQGLYLPVSIAGTQLSHTVYNTLPQTEYSYPHFEDIANNSDCSSYNFTSADFSSLLARQLLGVSYFNFIDEVLPSWLTLTTRTQTLTKNSAFTFEHYSTFVVPGENVNSIENCQGLDLIQNKIYSVISLKSIIVAEVVQDLYHYTPNGKETVCIAVDMCSGEDPPVYITLPPSSQEFMKSISQIQVYKNYDTTFIMISSLIDACE